jgi:transcriptional regulator with XRE-family HTH domain
MDEHQKAAREMITRMLDATGLDPTGLARKAGLSPSTITRFMNSPVKYTISTKTLQKLAAAAGVSITMGGDPDDMRLTRLVVSYKAMSETAKQALERIALELASNGPNASPAAPSPQPKERAPQPPFPVGGSVKGKRVSRPLLTVVRQRRCSAVVDAEGR